MLYKAKEFSNRMKEDILGDGAVYGEIMVGIEFPKLIREITGVLLTVGILALPALLISLVNN